MLQLDEHIQALTAPTMELALIQKKRAVDLGLEERGPDDLLKKFISQAVPLGPGGRIGTAEPGQLNPDASESPRGGPLQYQTGQEQPPLPSLSRHRSEPESVVPGVGQGDLAAMQDEQMVIPQYGHFQLDAYLRMARRAAARKAGVEPGTGEPNKWASVAGGLNTAIEKVPEAAAIYQAGKSYVKPMLDIGFGASHMGASLGYSPQGEGLPGASHILGIPNPIAAFTSPAAKQGLGTVVNAAEAAFGGTGIGVGEANQLRQGLAQQGWSNQREGGALGFTVGGQQENLAQTLEPLVKMGFNSPTSIEQLGSWTNSLKLGAATPKELKDTLAQLPEAVKVLHKTLEEVTAGMEEFAAKAVQGGSTMIHGAQVYNGVWKNTGMNPLLTQTMNESTFGKVAASEKGVLPWQIASMSPNQTSANAMEAVRKLAIAAGNPGAGRATTNVYGEKEPGITAEAAKLAQMHLLDPTATPEYLKQMLALDKKVQPDYKGTKMQAIESGGTQATGLSAWITKEEQANAGRAPHPKEEHDLHGAEARLRAAEGEVKGDPHNTLKQGALLAAEASVTKARNAMEATKTKPLTATQEGKAIHGLAGKEGLYQRAKEAGIDQHQIQQWMTEAPKQQVTDINAALAKAGVIEPEKDEKAKAEIVMNDEAAKWFKLQFPNAKSPNPPGAGGKSSASSAAQPNNGSPDARFASQERQAAQISRHESTVGG